MADLKIVVVVADLKIIKWSNELALNTLVPFSTLHFCAMAFSVLTILNKKYQLKKF